MTVKEYLKIYKKYPDPNSNKSYHTHYEGEEEDYNKLIEYNKKLVEDYPFLKPRNVWTGLELDDYDYSYTELDSMPDGWRIAFGMQMCEEIKQALLKVQEENPNGGYKECDITNKYDSNKIIPYLEGYLITQIKEKYGGLRWYDGGAPKGVQEIINKYEKLSYNTCIICGEPATYVTTYWISSYCTSCKEKLEQNKVQEEFVPIEEYYE